MDMHSDQTRQRATQVATGPIPSMTGDEPEFWRRQRGCPAGTVISMLIDRTDPLLGENRRELDRAVGLGLPIRRDTRP